MTDIFDIENQPIERRSSIRLRHKKTDDDESTVWSIGSNGGLSRSSQDDGLVFQNNEQLNNNEDDERLFSNDDRMSFTREQLVEYQQLIKLLRFVKSAGRCTTILSLALLHDYNLQDQSAFFAFKDTSTINVLLNFLEMFDRDLKLNALYVLRNACENASFAYEIFHLGGIITIIDSMCLDHIGIEESCMILIQLLKFRRARRVIRRCGGISKLITLLDELSDHNIFQVLILLCQSEKNKYVCIRYGIGKVLLKIILNNTNYSIISLLAILLQIPVFRMQMMEKDLVVALINRIDVTKTDLTRVICESLYYLSMIIDNHGFEELWTLFKLSSLSIQIAAGSTIRNCLLAIANHGELIRSFDGIFYLILNTLSTDNIDLLCVTLSLIAEIENLQLSKPFCDALANLLDLSRNQKQFGNRRVIAALKNYFKQQNIELSRPLTKTIYDLSLIPSNCVILHDVGIASDLLQLIANDDPIVQEKAANALRNMRQLLDDNRQVERTLNKNISQNSR
ncbi:hypothetical protein I4U23_031053 [Adineta vaga]|nr:hypothetical protein I4U23_031053 [Adineta vaga]